MESKAIIFSIYLALYIQLSSQWESSECGRSKLVERTTELLEEERTVGIIGGTEAVLGEFPWLVSLTVDELHRCGGTVINSRWILTSAHCVIDVTEKIVGNIIVKAGFTDSLRPERKIQTRRVIKTVLYPGYDPRHNVGDLALLLLNKELDMEVNVVDSVCQPDSGLDITGSDVYVAGWGREENTDESGASQKLMFAPLKVISAEECQMIYTTTKGFANCNEGNCSILCAGSDVGKDACHGDSGGGLVRRSWRHNKSVYTLVGIVANGLECGVYPGIYMNVSYYEQWIQGHVFGGISDALLDLSEFDSDLTFANQRSLRSGTHVREAYEVWVWWLYACVLVTRL